MVVRHHFKIMSDGPNNMILVNDDIKLHFIYDIRYDEVGINVSKKDDAFQINILSIFQEIMPQSHRDVFDYLKHEYESLDSSLLKLKDELDGIEHSFYLLTVCSVCMKNYDQIIQSLGLSDING